MTTLSTGASGAAGEGALMTGFSRPTGSRRARAGGRPPAPRRCTGWAAATQEGPACPSLLPLLRHQESFLQLPLAGTLAVLLDEPVDLAAGHHLDVGRDAQLLQLDPAPHPEVDPRGPVGFAAGVPEVQRPVGGDVAVRLVPRRAGLLAA